MKKIYQLTLSLLSLALMPLLTSCDKLVYEDLSKCEQWLDVSFYTKTPCMDSPAKVGKVEGLHLFVFDLNDKLVKSEVIPSAVDLNLPYKLALPQAQDGVYSVIAWSGATSSYFDLQQFKVGSTTKEQVMMSLKANAALGTHKVYQGESKTITMPSPSTHGSVTGALAINMQELTNRFNLTLKLHETVQDTHKLEDFEVAIESANGTYHINGFMPLGTQKINYPVLEGETSQSGFEKTFTSTLLKLKTGYSNRLIIRNTKEDKEYLNQDLIAKILGQASNVNLDCEHDFNIEVIIEDKCKSCPQNNLVVTITVNNWTVHSFPVELVNRL